MDEIRKARRGWFADGQAAIDAGAAPVGRFSIGQEVLDKSGPTVTGSFADGQALRHPPPVPEGRFSTGQEQGGVEPAPTAPAPAGRRERHLEFTGHVR